MKKIINGRKYDTDTACCVGTIYKGRNKRDYCYYEESLFQKKTGEFFLYGEGGPSSKYRNEVAPHSWESGEKIIPITIEEAKRWCEENISVDEYVTLFGDVEE